MKRLYIKRFLRVFGILILAVLILISLKIVMFRFHSINNIKVSGESITYERPKSAVDKVPTKWDDIEPEKTKESLVEGISIYHEGEKVNIKIYEKGLRYYVDFKRFINEIGGDIERGDDKEILTYKKKKVELHRDKNIYSKEYEALEFRGEILNIDDIEYVSLNDIESMLDLRDTWDTKKGIIYTYNDKNHINKAIACRDGKGALIRLEDVAAGACLKSSTAKEKMKIIADNLYLKGAKFHVAWVPRYKEPSKGIDNDLLKNNNIDNIQFINMLDHLIQKGGVIGLHGYTHQSGDDTSLNGFELTRKINSTEEETRKIVESAIVTAKTFNIPIGFFETPHYGATRAQQRIVEDYFNVIYEPYAGYYNANPVYSFRDKNRVYVPTMFGYVKDKHGEAIVKKIENSGDFVLKSIFVHPSVEIGFVSLKDQEANGYRNYTYNQSSPLNNIIKALYKKGYSTITVNNF